MIILHICYINNNKASGISNVVPEHFKNQKKHNKNVGILNCNDLMIEKLQGEKNVFSVSNLKKGSLEKLDKPFNQPDLVIFHDVYIPIYIRIAKYLNKKNIPYVIIPHGSLSLYAQKMKKFKKIIANLLLFNKFINNSLYIQYLSDDEKKMSKKFKHKSFVLGNGIDSVNTVKEDFNKDRLKLIYIGRYSIYHKGIDILLESCLKSREYMENNNISLDMFGANPKSEDGYEYIKKYIKNNDLENIIKLNGPVYDNGKTEQLLSHDFFIQTSRVEGQPLGIMEAMMYGLPIIASEGTTFGEIIEKYNCGYKCSTPEEFEKTISKALQEKETMKEMSINSLAYAKENFSWDVVAKKSLELYEKIIKNK